MKILVDMNLTPEWVQFFATEGIESRHWSTSARIRILPTRRPGLP